MEAQLDRPLFTSGTSAFSRPAPMLTAETRENPCGQQRRDLGPVGPVHGPARSRIIRAPVSIIVFRRLLCLLQPPSTFLSCPYAREYNTINGKHAVHVFNIAALLAMSSKMVICWTTEKRVGITTFEGATRKRDRMRPANVA